MKIAIIHHHLNRGGVTQVIANQLRALDSVVGDEPVEACLFYGGRKAAWPENFEQQLNQIRLQEVVLEQLDYEELWEKTDQPDSGLFDLFTNLTQRFQEFGLTRDNCLLHIHNHSLGKNWALIEAIDQLQKSGYRMLLQIHDFAEDFRPLNFLKLQSKTNRDATSLLNVLYPAAPHVALGVINQRDAENLNRLGIDASRIKYVPNPVATIEGITETHTAKLKLERASKLDSKLPFLVYPVRGIRRKNIGEAILLTLVAESPIQVGFTLPPLNPVEAGPYQWWKALAHDLRLPVWFEIGQVGEVTFADILSAADQILSTSVAEGFGMAFLEGLAIGKPLIGRNLPEITADFSACEIQFPNLYDQLRIPTDAISLADYRTNLAEILQRLYRDYERELDAHLIDVIIEAAIERGWIDFAKLPFHQQLDFVRSAFGDAVIRSQIRELNPRCAAQLATTRLTTADEQIRDSNLRCVEENFSFQSIGNRVLTLYRELMEVAPGVLPALQGPNALIDSFLDPGKIYPIRFESSQPPEAETTGGPWRDVILENSAALAPIPTELQPRLQELEGVKAVMFDIYGTLLVSSSGDIGTDQEFGGASDELANNRLLQLLSEAGLSFGDARRELKSVIVKRHEALRELGVPSPEIDIVAIWERLIRTQLMSVQAGSPDSDTPQGSTKAAENLSLGWQREKIKELAIRYELATNPVFPMPHLVETLTEIRERGLKLGIISNAQFYTSQIVEAFCGASLEQIGFDSDLSFFSYCFGRAKPDVFLYNRAAERLSGLGITPDQVLYVGNHMAKDIVPAKTVGFRTGLFAGDQRSLRLDRHTPPLPAALVDLILTDLDQIVTCLPKQKT